MKDIQQETEAGANGDIGKTEVVWMIVRDMAAIKTIIVGIL